MEIKLEGADFILLQAVLKAAGVCETGGEAKMAIVSGKVKVDGAVETRRGKKIHGGQTVTFGSAKITIIN